MQTEYPKGTRLLIELCSGTVYEGNFFYGDNLKITVSNVSEYPENIKYDNLFNFYKMEIQSITIMEENVEESPEKKAEICQEYDHLKELAYKHKYISVVDNRFHSAMDYLKICTEITVFGFGCPYGRNSKISLLGIGTKKEIFLFDIKISGARAFDLGLRNILETDDINKVVHDSKILADCLKHQYNVSLNNVFDTQVADYMISQKNNGVFPEIMLPFADCVHAYLNVPANIIKISEGSQKQFSDRPIPEELKLNSALRITYLLPLKNVLNKKMLLNYNLTSECFLNCMREQENVKALTFLTRDVPAEVKEFLLALLRIKVLESPICGLARTASKTECPRQPGPLARVSGRDIVPPAKRRWVPPSTLRHQDVLNQENRNDLIFRKVRGILNKLTPENFKKLCDDLLGTELNSSVILKGVILLIFDKALDEPKYSSMYAQLCRRLSKEAPNFEPDDQPCTFRLLLLNKCKAEFENRSASLEQYGASASPEEEERRQLAKRKMLGNIKFIGELAKLEILSESILHKCIQQLLVDKRRRCDTPQDVSEDLECLCQILRTCGRILDTNKGQKLMEQYFERMKTLADSPELPPRIRFMLKDVIELRADSWVPRKATTVEGPMPINQIRPNDEYMMRGDRRNVDRGDRDNDRGSNELFRHRMKVRSGIEDMLAGISLGPSSTSLISQHADKFLPYRAHNHNNQQRYMYNQRGAGGFNKHNQNNQHSNNNANKELAPRFKKSLIAAREQNLGDLELRPSANSMLFNQPSMNKQPNNMVMNKVQDLNMVTNTNVNKAVLPAPTPLLKEPLPIKQASTDKAKQTKKDKGPNKEEVLKKLTVLVDEFLQENANLTQTLETYRDHKVPDKYAKDVILHALNMCIDKSDANREKIIKLISALRTSTLITTSTFLDSIKSFLHTISTSNSSNSPSNTPSTDSDSTAVILAYTVQEHLLPLSDLASLTENGAHHPLFLLVLQQLHKVLSNTELITLFNASKVNLLSQLPEGDRKKERLQEILEDRDLTFLYPLLRIQAELAKQLLVDPQPSGFYKWIKDHLDKGSLSDQGFINALMTVLLKYMMNEAGSTGADLNDKGVLEKEKGLLKKWTMVLQHFLHERVDLQVTAVYSLQAHCHALGFPKGLLLRWFMALYDLEVVEEEAFLQWKEDLTDAYPGKGQALFQVNQWLTWLQEAESEDDEADD